MSYIDYDGISAEMRSDVEFEDRWNKKIKREVFGINE